MPLWFSGGRGLGCDGLDTVVEQGEGEEGDDAPFSLSISDKTWHDRPKTIEAREALTFLGVELVLVGHDGHPHKIHPTHLNTKD